MGIAHRSALLTAAAAAVLVTAALVALPSRERPASARVAVAAAQARATTDAPVGKPAVTVPPLPVGSGTAAGEATPRGSDGAVGMIQGTPSGAATPVPSTAAASSSPGAPGPSGTATSGSTSTGAPTPRPATKTPPPRSSSTAPPAPPRTAAPSPTPSPTPHTASRTPAPPARSTPPPPAPSRSASPAPPPAPAFPIPVTLGNATQVVTVAASGPGATTGTLSAWQRGANGTWSVVLGPYPAWLGSAGIGPASEYASYTPLGTFTLTQAFGRLADPGTALPYHRTVPDDWWVSDVNSSLYNTMQTCAPGTCLFDTSVSEHLYYEVPYYNYAVVMNVNDDPAVPGAGSAFFLHVTDHEPTAGCVALDVGNLLAVMRWLDPADHPRIATGID